MTYSQLDAGALLENNDVGGLEMLVIAGSVFEGDEVLEKGSWLRLPDGMALVAKAGVDGAKLWIKTGHLPYAKAPAV